MKKNKYFLKEEFQEERGLQEGGEVKYVVCYWETKIITEITTGFGKRMVSDMVSVDLREEWG